MNKDYIDKLKSGRPCSCIKLIDQDHFVIRCYCKDGNDMHEAKIWCVERNLKIEIIDKLQQVIDKLI